ncbi:uncharacterized protein LOC129574851 [Sitodiplosis mosellana]|uniref:uncharacterized protein LOC129574851 n=1 Tax=Sitodiplosis mosellana TaxID=263140 RepID=UPI002444CC2E|nr:uncharacterized protein LOC129574851 [Sitodiplosis mosellana]
MSKAVFAVAFAFAVTVLLVSKDAMSAPQFSYSGGNGTSFSSGGVNNQTSNIPGSGYGGEYYNNHSNETAPTSPSMSGSQVSGAQNSTSNLTNNCDCNNVQNVQEMAPTDAGATNSPSEGAGNPSDAASAASSAASGSSSRK